MYHTTQCDRRKCHGYLKDELLMPSAKSPIFCPTLIHLHQNQHYMQDDKNWHEVHEEDLTFGDRLADAVANGMGSWSFIIIQTIIVLLWMALNFVGFVYHWDPYPFILLNLVFSTQAAYAAPIIMMAQNRQSDRDRIQAAADYKTNIEAKLEIEALAIQLNTLEVEKLDKIINLLNEMKANQSK